MDPMAILERVLDTPRVVYVRSILDTYGRAPGGLLANGLAFATLFAALPVALLVLGAAGLFVGDPTAQEDLARALKELFPPLASFVDQALQAVTAGATAASIFGLVGTVWAVSQLYVTLDVAFSRIFSETPERDLVRRTVRGFLWVGGLIALVAGLIVLGTVASIVSTLFPGDQVSLDVVRGVLGSPIFLLIVGVVVTGAIYRVLPATTPAFSSIWPAAVVVGIVVVVLSQVFVVLAPILVGAAKLAGSLATAFIALAWLSFTFQAVLYGASWVRVAEDRRVKLAALALGAAAPPAEPGGGGE